MVVLVVAVVDEVDPGGWVFTVAVAVILLGALVLQPPAALSVKVLVA